MFRKVKTIIDSNPQIPGRSWSWVESLAVGNAEENEDMKKINYYSLSWNFSFLYERTFLGAAFV